jgi:LytS/YehU family sensor histidine kinase
MVYIGFAFLVLFMLISLSIQTREQIRSQQSALLHSRRLEIELLKKNIEPHFLMNSLTSLMEWVERSPSKGIDFINALAAEFSILNNISSQQLIPVDQEIELCRSHLKIMGFRKDTVYRLETININTQEKIPPAVILTIIENGISHNLINNENNVFTITYCREKNNKIYTMFAPGEVKDTGEIMVKGTGIRYIEARLEESFPGKWRLTSQAVERGWETEITIIGKKETA